MPNDKIKKPFLGTDLLFYQVELSDGSGVIKDKNFSSCTKHKIIGENDDFIVIENTTFTTIKISSKDEFNTYPILNKESISLHTRDSIWGNSVWYRIYSTTPIPAKKIRRAVEQKIKKEFGFFLAKLDLSFITDKSISISGDAHA